MQTREIREAPKSEEIAENHILDRVMQRIQSEGEVRVPDERVIQIFYEEGLKYLTEFEPDSVSVLVYYSTYGFFSDNGVLNSALKKYNFDQRDRFQQTISEIRKSFTDRLIQTQLERTRILSRELDPMGNNPITVLLRGNSSTGKTRIFSGSISTDEDKHNKVTSFTQTLAKIDKDLRSKGTVNPDVLKHWLQSDALDTESETHVHPDLTSFQVHREGALLCKSVITQSIQERLSLIIDKRHLEDKDITIQFEECLKNSRRLHVIDVDGSLRNSLFGILERPIGGLDPNVPPSAIVTGFYQSRIYREKIIQDIERLWGNLTEDQKHSFDFSYEIWIDDTITPGKKMLVAFFDKKIGQFVYLDKDNQSLLYSGSGLFNDEESLHLEYFNPNNLDLLYSSVEKDPKINELLTEEVINEYCSRFNDPSYREKIRTELMRFKGKYIFEALKLKAEGNRFGTVEERVSRSSSVNGGN